MRQMPVLRSLLFGVCVPNAVLAEDKEGVAAGLCSAKERLQAQTELFVFFRKHSRLLIGHHKVVLSRDNIPFAPIALHYFVLVAEWSKAFDSSSNHVSGTGSNPVGHKFLF